MGLIQPNGPSWAYCTHNLPANLDAQLLGTQCISGTSNNDGTEVMLFDTPLSHDTEYLKLAISGDLSAGRNNDILLTVLIDRAGGTNWDTLIPYLISGAVNDISTSGSAAAGPTAGYDFPIWIPAGASLAIRARTAHSSPTTLHVAAFAYGGNSNPASWWCGQRVTAIGINQTSSTGTSHSPGSSSTFSAWADLGTPLDADTGALQIGVNGAASSFYFNANYLYELGVGGHKIAAPIFRVLTTSETGWWIPTGPIFKKLAAGTQLQARGACSATGQSLGIAAYAVH